MNRRRIAIIAASSALAATGAGVAVGASSGKEAEQAVLDRAAEQLGTTPEKLRDALADAQEAQLDAAVKAGELTKAQADAIKRRRAESGRVLGRLGGPGGPGFGHHRGGRRSGAVMLAEVAEALGLRPAELREQLRDGRTLAEIAKAQSKSVASVKSSVQAAVRKRLDAKVERGELTRAQADERLERLAEHFDRFAEGRLRGRGPRP